MKTVPLNGAKAAGRVALVDDADYDLVMQYRWRVHEGSKPVGRPAVAYARTSIGRKTVDMHRMLTGYEQTDHRNGDGLDNQRSNLRPATQAQNRANTPKLADCASPYKGVTKAPRSTSWCAKISVEGCDLYLGTFPNPVDAARAYDIAAVAAHGDYARLNFPSLFQSEPEWSREAIAAAKRRPAKPIKHGTHTGHNTHRYRGEDPCDSCFQAERDYRKALRNRGSTTGAVSPQVGNA